MSPKELLSQLSGSALKKVQAQLGHGEKPKRKKSAPVLREMNNWEKEYARRLDLLKLDGEVLWWAWESVVLRLADRTTYIPDFIVLFKSGAVEIHETKGFEREDSAVRFKIAAEMFPCFRFLVLTKKNKQWVVKRDLNARPCGERS